MSSNNVSGKRTRCAALALSGLLLSTLLPLCASAANNDSDENWIKDTAPEQVEQSANRNNAPAIAEPAARPKSEMVAPDDPSFEGDLTSDESGAAPRKVAQVLPHGASVPNVPVAATVPTSAAESAPSAPLLKGGVTYCVPSGTPLKLKLATIPMPELKGEVKDMEGKYSPAQLDQEITARITEDIYVDDNKVIPQGTIFHGKVSHIYAPRHVGRPGHLDLSFDRFTTPDGRKFSFIAEANNFKDSTAKTKAQGAGRLLAYAGGGALTGALVAYKVFGLQNTIAMHGYNIAGGAALGATGGIAYALWKRGDQAVLEPGDEFNLSIDKDMLIPAATKPTPKKAPITIPGFEMAVISKKIVHDGLGGDVMRINTLFTNHSNKKLSSIDLFLEDENGGRYGVSPDEDENAEEVFTVNPLSVKQVICGFQVMYPKLKHKIVWLDHNTHRVIFEQKL